MTTEYELGRLGGLSLSARPSAIAGSIGLWAVLTVVAAGLFSVPIGESIVAGLIAAALHWVSEITHQLGHARAARATGHPMIGIRLWGVLSTALYPADEGRLPAAVHIRRALGGPAMSLLVTLAAGAIALALRSVAGTLWLLATFFFLDNLLVLTLGSFLPLGFTDGSTLLEWWGKR
jgi:hypothetical protein